MIKEREKEIIEKKGFIKKIEEALFLDHDRSGVKAVNYIEYATNQEVIVIEYYGGHMAWINVTANSNGANMREIAGEVYGAGSIGHFEPKKDFREELISRMRKEKM